jgi:hypothetical protein
MGLDLGRALLHVGQLRMPPSHACRPSQLAPPLDLAKGTAMGPVGPLEETSCRS